jgi:hypothetical protein
MKVEKEKSGKVGGIFSSEQTSKKTPNRTDRQYKRATQDIFLEV